MPGRIENLEGRETISADAALQAYRSVSLELHEAWNILDHMDATDDSRDDFDYHDSLVTELSQEQLKLRELAISLGVPQLELDKIDYSLMNQEERIDIWHDTFREGPSLNAQDFYELAKFFGIPLKHPAE